MAGSFFFHGGDRGVPGPRAARYARTQAMRVHLGRRELGVIGLVAALAVSVAVLGVGPLVRARVGTEAARRHLEVQVGSVRPTWFGVRLRDVTARPEGTVGITAHVDEIDVLLGFSFRPKRVELHGAAVSLKGREEELRGQWARWRQRSSTTATSGSRRRAVVVVDGASIRWDDGRPSG